MRTVFFVVMALLLCLTLPWTTGHQGLDDPLLIDRDVGDTDVLLVEVPALCVAIPIGGHVAIDDGTMRPTYNNISDVLAYGDEEMCGPGIMFRAQIAVLTSHVVFSGQAHDPG